MRVSATVAYLRVISVRTQSSQEARLLLTLRQQVVGQKVALENDISGSLKLYSLVIPRDNVVSAKFRKTMRRRAAGEIDVKRFLHEPVSAPR